MYGNSQNQRWKGLVQFKDPKQEGVNANFLTMVTSPTWSERLAKAYEDLYGKKLVLTTPNAGYEWIKRWFQNGLILGNSDTTISENIGIKGQKAQTMGLFVYSKTRYDDAKNLALLPMTDVQPFSGFMYPAFLQMTKNAKNKNAAKLFIEYTVDEFDKMMTINISWCMVQYCGCLPIYENTRKGENCKYWITNLFLRLVEPCSICCQQRGMVGLTRALARELGLMGSV